MKNLLEGLESRKLFSGTDHVHDATCFEPGLGRAGGDYQIGARWSSTATNPSTGSNGAPITLTWGFVADGFTIPSGGVPGEVTAPSILRARLTSIYGSLATATAVFQQVFDRWSQFSGITYVYQDVDDGASFIDSPGVLGVRPDVRIGGHHLDGGSNVLAYNYFPNSGDMVFDTDEFVSGGYLTNTSSNSRRLRNVLAHEHGHGLGLGHVEPVNQTKLMEPFVTTSFDGPQFDDILAIQSLYGDANEKNGRNNTAATATNLGTLANGNNQPLVQWNSISNVSDTDYFQFTVPAGKNVSFTLQPEGTTYLQGPQGGTPTSFNAGAQGNLNMALYDTNGTTVLQVANANPTGSSEVLSNLNLSPGSYYVRVTMPTGSAQMYKLLATVSSSLVAPSAPDLAASSDSGQSDSDDITSDNTPTFSGTASANTTVQLFDGVTLVGSTTANASGNWTITSSPLADGGHTLTAKTTDGVNLSPASSPTLITIDTLAPAAPSLAVFTSDDSGLSDSDGITNLSAPRFSGAAEAMTSVRIRDGATEILTASSTGTYLAAGSSPFADGSYSLVAEAIDLAGNTSTTVNLVLVIDTSAPAIASATYDRETTQNVAVAFTEPVAGMVDLADLLLTNTTTATTVAISSATASGDNLSVDIDFGTLLANGRYQLGMPFAAVTDLAGNPLGAPLSLEFVQLAGDANGDGVTDFDDLLVLAQNYGSTGKGFSQGNFDYDTGGTVDFSDLLVLAQNYSASVVRASTLGSQAQSKRRTNTREILT